MKLRKSSYFHFYHIAATLVFLHVSNAENLSPKSAIQADIIER